MTFDPQRLRRSSDVLARSCRLLRQDRADAARDLVAAEYPLDDTPAPPCFYEGPRDREHTIERALRSPRRGGGRLLELLHARDGYIDRYTGARLVAPCVLKLLGHEKHGPLRDVLPYHVNGGRGMPARRGAGHVCHQAGFELYASYEHVRPVSVDGEDHLGNLVTASVDTNYAKNSETWQPTVGPGSLDEWDGLAGWFLEYTQRKECSWVRGLTGIRRRIQTALEADHAQIPAPACARP